MSTETDRKALALYPFDGSDPDLILALHAAFRAGAEFAAECAPAWDEETLTNEALLLARAALAQASPSQSTPWVARLVDEVVDSTLAVVRDHLPVKPDRETVARALVTRELYGKGLAHVRIGVSWDCLLPETCERYLDQADAALDLWPGRSEAEVKAEALRDFAARVRDETDDSDKVLGTKWATDEYRHGMRSALMQVDEEADRLAAEGGADRG